ncbi:MULTISPECIES: YutD-like domain-containing protein [unclassified Gemella]|uniref:YutD-like domain-containing protein n=1 Tax=unclassified Gemella TaxID=2624949 RepID=UPI001C04BCDC|nr:MULTISPECIES: YutD-like domain-containing protein [unclassified Gemella]MBU0278657.1 DUF1027 domain-containing protein [Gemella sp. zg-1178]QWQ39213.1 DUF1027 domain-containing protein [Gemella sp. zg-570]
MQLTQENLVLETEYGKFELIFNYKNAFDKELFLDKYIDILDDKPFIVGDIAYEKLRLSGFFNNKDKNHPKNIRNLEEYLLEFCNLACPFFVLKRI